MSEAKEVAEKLIEWSNFSSIYMAGAKQAAEKLPKRVTVCPQRIDL